MQLREWFGLAPTKAGFARELLALLEKAGNKGWIHDPEQDAIRLGTASQINLTNLFLEYTSAARAHRSALLRKYAQMAQAIEKEVPKLWTVAAKNIYAVLRSPFDQMTLEIQSRNAHAPWPKTVARPFAHNLQLRLVYDLGAHVAHVRQDLLDTWGQSLDAVFEITLRNLSALPRPSWNALPNGVYELSSEASYEESFMLVARTFDALPFKDFVVCAPSNRGVLLCADSRSNEALIALVNEAMHRHQERPWPLSSSFFSRSEQGWQEFHMSGEAGKLARDFQRLDRAAIYKDQKEALDALHKQQEKDIFVASMQLMRKTKDAAISSYCVWSKGVQTLLPKTDLIALNPMNEDGSDDVALVRWEDMESACGHRLASTQENPPRYLVDSFPDDKEWAAVSAARL